MKNKLEKMHDEILAKIKSKKRVPLLRVIRMKCADCVCWQENEIRLCPIEDCILWEFRMGKNPIKREMTDSARKALSDRMKKLHNRL